eukprot:614375_1
MALHDLYFDNGDTYMAIFKPICMAMTIPYHYNICTIFVQTILAQHTPSIKPPNVTNDIATPICDMPATCDLSVVSSSWLLWSSDLDRRRHCDSLCDITARISPDTNESNDNFKMVLNTNILAQSQ